MKRYVLIIAAGALFYTFQVKTSEKSLRTFKDHVTEVAAYVGRIYDGHSGLNSDLIKDVAGAGKDEAIEKKIPFNKAASIVIDALVQKAFDDLYKMGLTDQRVKQTIFKMITEIVQETFKSH
jgi:hypothetical protein